MSAALKRPAATAAPGDDERKVKRPRTGDAKEEPAASDEDADERMTAADPEDEFLCAADLKEKRALLQAEKELGLSREPGCRVPRRQERDVRVRPRGIRVAEPRTAPVRHTSASASTAQRYMVAETVHALPFALTVPCLDNELGVAGNVLEQPAVTEHKDWLRDIMCAEQLWRLFNNKAHTYEVGDGHEPLFNEDFNNILTVYLRPEPPADGGKDRKRGQESKGEGKDGKEAKGGEEATASEACHFRECDRVRCGRSESDGGVQFSVPFVGGTAALMLREDQLAAIGSGDEAMKVLSCYTKFWGEGRAHPRDAVSRASVCPCLLLTWRADLLSLWVATWSTERSAQLVARLDTRPSSSIDRIASLLRLMRLLMARIQRHYADVGARFGRLSAQKQLEQTAALSAPARFRFEAVAKEEGKQGGLGLGLEHKAGAGAAASASAPPAPLIVKQYLRRRNLAEDSYVFEALLADGSRALAKFQTGGFRDNACDMRCAEYPFAVHQAAAKIGLAPRLLGKIQSRLFHAALMELLPGAELSSHPPHVRVAALKALAPRLARLHELGLVHSDVRPENLRDVSADIDPARVDAWLVDWSWAGRADVDSYRHHPNPALLWRDGKVYGQLLEPGSAIGVHVGHPLRCEHDRTQLARLRRFADEDLANARKEAAEAKRQHKGKKERAR